MRDSGSRTRYSDEMCIRDRTERRAGFAVGWPTRGTRDVPDRPTVAAAALSRVRVLRWVVPAGLRFVLKPHAGVRREPGSGAGCAPVPGCRGSVAGIARPGGGSRHRAPGRVGSRRPVRRAWPGGWRR